ncbi:unnamed protein product [Ectocarpus sp. CCAP 1310/34]|nr:unnamed protein product [Ectocarpus sp. CCAP 1310/34]
MERGTFGVPQLWDLHIPHQGAFHARPTAALSSSSVALPDDHRGIQLSVAARRNPPIRRTRGALLQRRRPLLALPFRLGLQ